MTAPSLGPSLDARGADLAGESFSFRSLQDADFDGADLSGARFWHVDLTGASMRGANLEHATFQFVRAGGVNLESARGADCVWDRASLVGARLIGTHLCRARLTGCDLQSAVFDGADLTLGSLASSSLGGASFANTNLERTETFGCDVDAAGLLQARSFAFCRELVVAVLRDGLTDDLATMKWLGAVALLRQWCYPAWATAIGGDSEYLDRAARVFAHYPLSGCSDALADARAGFGKP